MKRTGYSGEVWSRRYALHCNSTRNDLVHYDAFLCGVLGYCFQCWLIIELVVLKKI